MSVVASRPRPGRLRAAWGDALRRRRRRILAQGYETVLRDARDPRDMWRSPRVPVDRAQVLAAAPEIERLIALLRDQERPLREDGMTLARAHLVDRDSPLFERAARGTLRRRVRVVCEAVE